MLSIIIITSLMQALWRAGANNHEDGRRPSSNPTDGVIMRMKVSLPLDDPAD